MQARIKHPPKIATLNTAVIALIAVICLSVVLGIGSHLQLSWMLPADALAAAGVSLASAPMQRSTVPNELPSEPPGSGEPPEEVEALSVATPRKSFKKADYHAGPSLAVRFQALPSCVLCVGASIAHVTVHSPD